MENSGIMYTIIYRRMAAVFPYFSGKRQQRGKYIKMRKSAHKKEFCNTIMRRRKIRENSSKKRILQHDNAQEWKALIFREKLN